MEFQSHDIFTRRERDTRIAVFVSQEWLVENVKGLTEKRLRTRCRPQFLATVKSARHKKQSILPDTNSSWRYAKKNGTYYYDFDRLSAPRKKQLPTKEELLDLYDRAMKAEVKSEVAGTLDDFIADLTPWRKHYKECTDIQAEHLARACAVVQFAANEVGSKAPTSSNDYYRTLAAVIKERGWVYLPKNYRKVKEKVMAVVNGESVTSVIKLPRKGNNNRKAYDNEQVIRWMLYLRSRPENYGNAHIARRILKMCAISDITPPSFSWLEHFFSDTKNKWLTGASRHRSNRQGWEYRDYIPVAGALYAGDCWQCDGTRVNFIPHQSKDGKEKSLMIIAIRDVHSGDIVGFHLDTKEDRYGYLHALNMAVTNTGHLPYELVHDRFPGYNTPEWDLITQRMEREGVKVTVTSTATGKSHVERCFSTMQDVFMQDFDVYYGQGIRSTREAARRSAEFLQSARKRAKKEGWGFDDAWKAASEVVHRYRNTKLSEYSRKNANVEHTPRELYDISEKPNVKPLDPFTRAELFGTMRPATVRNNGIITMQIHKAKYVYKITDYDIIKNYKKVNVYYDIEDLSTIYLFAPGNDINSKFLCEVKEEEAVQYYGPDADFKALAKAKAARKEIADRRKEELEEMTFGAKDEVDLLMSQLIPKTTTDTAETAFLLDRVNAWQDKGTERRIELTPTAEDEDDLGELVVVRNY